MYLSDDPIDRLAAIDSALMHPFHVVTLDDDWVPVMVVGFQAEDEARMFASLRPENIIQLVKRDGEFGSAQTIGSRVLVQHPATVGDPGIAWSPRDDFPQEAS